jgi:hypothetical protein
VQPEQHHGGGDPDRQRGTRRQAPRARPTPPTMLLTAAMTLAPVNSIPAGRARSPTVAIAAVYRSSSAAGPKNWSASGTKVR